MHDLTVELFDLALVLFYQEKIKRIQQNRLEKELRAQQILEVRPESY